MNYVLTRLPCYEIFSKQRLLKDVWYKFEKAGEPCTFLAESCLPICVNFNDDCAEGENCCKVKHKGNDYFIISPKAMCKTSCASVGYLNKKVDICVSNNLYISVDGVCVLDVQVLNIEYDGFSVLRNYLILNFVGERNFVVIIKENKLLCADYYDEANITDGEVYFLKKLNDCINHGRVFCVSEGKFDSYLVYLDDYEMNLKQEFLSFVFLDLVIAKNFNYALSFLADDIKPKEADSIAKFLPEFDDFLPFNEKEICLIKNGKPCGVAEFDCANLKIENITIN